MIYTFESHFSAKIEDFIAQKNALGFGYQESSRLLRDFDRFCLAHFPDVDLLTVEQSRKPHTQHARLCHLCLC